MAKMKPIDRWKWIAERMNGNNGVSHFKYVDILNKHFVDDYVEATGAKDIVTWFGANKCPTLAKDLRDMYNARLLTRWRNGIRSVGCDGFPKWVWSYELAKDCWLLDKPTG
jgi:hypothetical protein